MNNGLRHINNRVYSSDKEQALSSAKANIELMLKYPKAFGYIRGGEKLLLALKNMAKEFKQTNFLTPKQLSYINEGIYEKFWVGISKSKNDPELAGATVKHDRVKTLKY